MLEDNFVIFLIWPGLFSKFVFAFLSHLSLENSLNFLNRPDLFRIATETD